MQYRNLSGWVEVSPKGLNVAQKETIEANASDCLSLEDKLRTCDITISSGFVITMQFNCRSLLLHSCYCITEWLTSESMLLLWYSLVKLSFNWRWYENRIASESSQSAVINRLTIATHNSLIYYPILSNKLINRIDLIHVFNRWVIKCISSAPSNFL